MVNSRLVSLISGIFLGLSVAFPHLNSSSYAGNIISNYSPSSPEKSKIEPKGFSYFDKLSETQNKIKIIKEKARAGKYINTDEAFIEPPPSPDLLGIFFLILIKYF